MPRKYRHLSCTLLGKETVCWKACCFFAVQNVDYFFNDLWSGINWTCLR